MSTTLRRMDAVSMGATPVETRPDGSKVYEGTAAFGDVVAPYPDLVPPRNEFRPADEVMSEEALKSLEGLRFTGGLRARDWDGKVTLPGDHTPELDDPNGEAIEGVVLRAWREDAPGEPPALRVRVIAHTRAMQELLENGTRGLSLGYVADEDKTPGTHNGKPYQVIQRRHRYYHLAAVRDPRSKTPGGRGARLDSYPPHAKANMKRLPRQNISPLAALALAVMVDKPAPAGPRFDAVTIPPADAELLKQMTPEVQAAIAAAMGGAVALEEGDAAALEGEAEASDDAGEALEEAAEADADMAQDAEMLAPVLAKIDAIMAALEAAGIKVGTQDAMPYAADAMPKMDKDGKPIVAPADANPKTPTRKDSANVPTIDPAKIIADATEAASKRFDAHAEFTATVRRDGHPADTVTEAATSMLAVIKGHLPMLAPVAEEAIKGQRLDSLVPLYKQAEAIRRKDLMESQSRSLRVLMDHAPGTGIDLGVNDLPTGDGITRAPMRS